MDYHDKELFHREWRRRFRALAKLLGWGKGSYRITSNKAGDGSVGDILLHGERLYLHAGHITLHDGLVLYRTCKGLSEYNGGRNCYLHAELLAKPVLSQLPAVFRDQ